MSAMSRVNELVGACPADAISLCWMDHPSREELAGMDLSLLQEIEVKPGGGVRVKLVDRVGLLCAALKD